MSPRITTRASLSRRGAVAALAASSTLPAVRQVHDALERLSASAVDATDGPRRQHGTPGSQGDAGPARAVREGDQAFVKVAVATAWLEPGQLRTGLDEPSASVPVDMEGWTSALSTFSSRRWLPGRTQTQGLLGAPVTVQAVSGSWAKVGFNDQAAPGEADGISGWVPARQLVTDPGFDRTAGQGDTAVVTATKTHLAEDRDGTRPHTPVSFETRLPVLEKTGSAVMVAVPGAEPAWLPADAVRVLGRGELPSDRTAAAVIATGQRFLGLKYLWAGMSSYGFDCSGFTYSIYRHHGILLPRDSGPQLHSSGLPKVDRADLQAGDLVFFSMGRGAARIRHVAVYIGDGKIMHSPATGKTIEITSLAGYDVNDEYAGAVRPPLSA